MINDEFPSREMTRHARRKRADSSQIAFPAIATPRTLNSHAEAGQRTPPTKSNLSALLEKELNKKSDDQDYDREKLNDEQPDHSGAHPRMETSELKSTIIGGSEVAASPRIPKHQNGLGRLGQSVPSSTSSWKQNGQAHLESFRNLQLARRRSSTISNKGDSAASYTNVVSPREHYRDPVRRCISNKDLGACTETGQGPYTYRLQQREAVQDQLQKRLHELRETNSRDVTRSEPSSSGDLSDGSSQSNKQNKLKNKERNMRRAEHTTAVINDLCEIVADLFVAESKLLNPSTYGIETSFRREGVVSSVHSFVSGLPSRYALSVETPSEVLLHMRLMAAARSDHLRAVVHIMNLDSTDQGPVVNEARHQVTIACFDVDGLLEYITKILGTGGSRVLDADVMLSSDGVVLNRFIVRMSGRLRIDKLSKLIESFLAKSKWAQGNSLNSSIADEGAGLRGERDPSGQLYFHAPATQVQTSLEEIQEEIQSAVPLSHVLADLDAAGSTDTGVNATVSSAQSLTEHSSVPRDVCAEKTQNEGEPTSDRGSRNTARRPLVNRDAMVFHDSPAPSHELEYVTAATLHTQPNSPTLEDRIIPIIPFEHLMLMEVLGTGRVTTIYKALWRRRHDPSDVATSLANGAMVALKVAMVSPNSQDTSSVDEVRREADIASILKHPSICDIVGIAADADCFCLAYEFCEGGSLLSLLSDRTRFYEYLPIALDIANGMAYLHSRNVIHRDLKPSNVLLTRDSRAKVSDFGMSVANTGQELTAETGTYRYMAPEVIRHESYSSNADVYSFGIVLWQLVTREIPFATKTPIQAAFAVAEGERPPIPKSTPPRIREIISACWDQDSHKRPSFVFIAMELADYARMAFNPANVGARTLEIANEMLACVHGNSTVNVDFSTPVTVGQDFNSSFGSLGSHPIGLEI